MQKNGYVINMIDYKIDVIAFLCSIGISLILGQIIIPLLRKLKAGQNVLHYVENHAGKAGTTTMGGFIFALSSVITFFIFSSGERNFSIISIIVSISFLCVGFLDDFIKIKSKRNEGLTVRQKLLFQIAISLLTSIFVFKNEYTLFFVPFLNEYIDLGIWSGVIVFFVFLATTNCVNLTDGLDGLAGGVSYVYFILLYLLIHLQVYTFVNNYVNITEVLNLATLSITQAGALIGFLFYNTFSAKVFMGDTGSLYLGGMIAVISIFSSNTLFIPFLGIMFVLSGISVIIQVLVYKKTKKRIFLMAPLHHHFEYKGHSESKIVFVYKMITLIIGLACIIGIA